MLKKLNWKLKIETLSGIYTNSEGLVIQKIVSFHLF